MLPKKAKHFIIPTADKLGIESQIVEDIIGFYYADVRKKLSNLEIVNLQIEKLGGFRINRKNLSKLKFKTELKIKNTKSPTSPLKAKMEVLVTKIENIDLVLMEEHNRKLEFLKAKYEK